MNAPRPNPSHGEATLFEDVGIILAVCLIVNVAVWAWCGFPLP